jgi:hypothetical protein
MSLITDIEEAAPLSIQRGRGSVHYLGLEYNYRLRYQYNKEKKSTADEACTDKFCIDSESLVIGTGNETQVYLRGFSP